MIKKNQFAENGSSNYIQTLNPVPYPSWLPVMLLPFAPSHGYPYSTPRPPTAVLPGQCACFSASPSCGSWLSQRSSKVPGPQVCGVLGCDGMCGFTCISITGQWLECIPSIFFLPKLWTQKYIACPFAWISIKESRRVRTRFFLDTLPSDDPRAGASSWDSWFSSSSLSLVGSCLTSGPNAKASCTERSLTDTLDTRSPASNNHGTIPIVIVIWDRCFHLSIVHSA